MAERPKNFLHNEAGFRTAGFEAKRVKFYDDLTSPKAEPETPSIALPPPEICARKVTP
jgi:hypothetical protein